MKTIISIQQREVTIVLSERANRALAERRTPLVAEMELYFSCLIRKKVRFYEAPTEGQLSRVSDQLLVGFRPVMTAACSNDDIGDEPPLTDFPLQRVQAFVPHWLKIDYLRGEWVGEFGYDSVTHSTVSRDAS